jgi:hypothetical protein
VSIWYAIPSIRPGGGTLPQWRARGYKIAVLRQGDMLGWPDIEHATPRYLGWAASINLLTAVILKNDPEADWIVTGGDDYLPSKVNPLIIGAECSEHFGGTFGVMQPTGDRWGEKWPQLPEWGGRKAVLDRVAGSPWLGREWCQRAYQGDGPMCASHFHCYADEELAVVAERLGVYWRRQDLTQYHDHAVRDNRQPDSPEAAAAWAVASRDYNAGRALFERRRAAGFPGSAPL